MSDRETILKHHAQHYRNSCAASGMELILKLHSLVDPSFRAFQDKYRDTNIGFEKLGDMAPHGVHAQDYEKPIDEGFQIVRSEVQCGRYPILSLFSAPVGWHIWVAVPHGDSFRLVSKAYGYDLPLDIDNLEMVRTNLNKYRNGKIHFVTYSLHVPNGA